MAESHSESSSGAPISSEAYENKLISLAMAEAKAQLESGEAPPGVIMHYLRLGSQRARLETDKLKAENEMLRAKAKALEAQARTDELYNEALRAFATYRSTAIDDD